VISLLISLASAADLHVVREGETLHEIVEAYGGDPGLLSVLQQLNDLGPDDQPTTGDLLILPGPELGYRVRIQQARVLSVGGTGTATPPGRRAVPLEEGLWLPVGTTVCTDRDSFVAVRLAVTTGTYFHDDISLLPETCLVVESAVSRQNQRSSVIEILQGGMSVRELQEGDEGRVTVRSAAGVTTGERGGYRVILEGETARTEALYQPVVVLNAGQEEQLEAGQGVRTSAGEAPGEVVQLLRAGLLVRPRDGESLRRPDFVWEPVDRALGYRVEIASTPDFTHVLVAQAVDVPEWRPNMLMVPYRGDGLWWRVSSFDRTGFMGIPSVPRELVFPIGVGP
jgi:hypothetical protein